MRPSGERRTSSQDILRSPVFVAESDDEAVSPILQGRPLAPRHNSGHAGPSGSTPRRHGRRRSRATSNAQDGYFPSKRRHRDSNEYDSDGSPESPSSPVKETTLSKLAQYMGFGRDEAGDEEEGMLRRRSSSRSRRGSFASQGSYRPASEDSSGWGLSDEDDDWSDRPEGEEGYTSSLADDTSLPPQSRPGSPNLPLVPLPGDGIFGDPARGIEEEPKDFSSIAVPSRQTILLPDEDLSIRFTCYSTDPFRRFVWLVGCFLSLGILGLIGRWIPRTWVRFCGQETAFEDAKDGAWLVVETPYGDLHIVPVNVIPYPYPLTTVFPQAIIPGASGSRGTSIRGQTGVPVAPVHALDGEQPGGVGAAKDLMHDVERGNTTWEETMGYLKVMEYRYTKFALEPGTGRWAMIR